MYRIRNPHYRKSDPDMRWRLPDRIFFACGACHILAQACLERHGDGGCHITWIKPDPGFSGHHIFVESRGWAFDFHGYSDPGKLLSHSFRTARRYWPGWNAALIAIEPAALVSEAASRAYDGLRLREPGQFLHDPLPRARLYLARFPAPTG